MESSRALHHVFIYLKLNQFLFSSHCTDTEPFKANIFIPLYVFRPLWLMLCVHQEDSYYTALLRTRRQYCLCLWGATEAENGQNIERGEATKQRRVRGMRMRQRRRERRGAAGRERVRKRNFCPLWSCPGVTPRVKSIMENYMQRYGANILFFILGLIQQTAAGVIIMSWSPEDALQAFQTAVRDIEIHPSISASFSAAWACWRTRNIPSFFPGIQTWMVIETRFLLRINKISFDFFILSLYMFHVFHLYCTYLAELSLSA